MINKSIILNILGNQEAMVREHHRNNLDYLIPCDEYTELLETICKQRLDIINQLLENEDD